MTTEVQNELSEYIFKKVGFTPTEGQKPILASGKRFILTAGGDQGGKSMQVSADMLQRIMEDLGKYDDNEPLLYWLVGPDYSQTAREFEYISDHLTAIFGHSAVYATKRVDPGYVTVTMPGERKAKIRIETKSGTDPRKLTRDSPNGQIGCEASQLDLNVWERMRSRAAHKRGWIIMSGTFEGSLGWYPQLWKAWQSGVDDRQSFSLPTWSNTFLYPGGRNDPEILKLERESSDAFFMERIAGIPVPPRGLVFGEFRPDIHVKDVEWVIGEPIYLWEDPGYGSQSAHALLVAQVINNRMQVFDEIYVQHLLQKEVIQLAMQRPWWKEEAKYLVSDPQYKDQHHSMTSVSEVWMAETGLYASGEKIRINEGTERLKGFLKPDPIMGVPGIVFNPKCAGVLSEFGACPNPFDGQTRVYRWKTDPEGNIVGQTPEDKYNHGIKAVIYGIVDRYGYGYVGNRQKVLVKRW